MQFDQLRYFLELVRVGNVGRAASRLGIGQPTLSRSMQVLEASLNSKLLVRHGRGVALTPDGVAFYERAEAALRLLHQPMQSFANPARIEGCVTVGLSSSSALALAAPLAKSFLDGYPGAKLNMLEANDKTLEQLIYSKRIDVSVLHEPMEIRDFNIIPVVRERLFLVLPPASDMAHMSAAVHFRSLAKIPLILQNPADGSRKLIMRAEKQHGIRLYPVLEVDGSGMLKAMIRNNIGYGIASQQSVQEEIYRGSLLVRPIDRPFLAPKLSILTTREVRPSHLTGVVIRIIQDTVRTMMESKRWIGGEALGSVSE